MSNRFTATEKWDDPWFCGLSPAYKLFWIYLCEKCNEGGIWNVNWPLVKFHCWEDRFDAAQFGDRIVILSDEKWFIKKFVLFQQKISTIENLNPDNNYHKHVIKILRKEGILDVNHCNITNEGHRSPKLGASKGVASPLGIGIGIGIGIGKSSSEQNQQVDAVFSYFCLVLGKKIRLSPERRSIIEKRLKEGRTVQEMNMAIDNFAKDDWPDRHKHCDIIYAIGVRNKIDNLDKWLSYQSKETNEGRWKQI